MIRRLPTLLQELVPSAQRGIVVLAYHLVEGGTDSPVDIRLSAFRTQLDLLAERFEVIPLSEALSADPLAPNTRVVLTFDDAYKNFADVIWPELQARALPCTLYAPLGFVKGVRRAPISGTTLAPCTLGDLRELASAGVEIGSHGVDHVNLRRASDSTLERELVDSRDTLQAELGIVVTSFCYPQAKYDARVVEATRRVYRSAVVAGGVRFDRGDDPLRIPRFPVRRDERAFERMLRSRIWLAEAAADRVRQLRA